MLEIGVKLLFVVVTTLAVSYGWGMRGTLCGGEQGALLPGALLGFCFAIFSPSEVIRQSYLMFTAVGACGMFCGGDMTYGETLSFSLCQNDAKSENYKRGMTAVFIKGGLWFGVAAAFLGIAVGVIKGTYSYFSIIVLMAVMPIVRLVGKWFFNKPLDAKNGVFPAIYFSKTRQESWGANLGMLAEMLIFMVVFADIYSMKLAFFGFLGGAIGWVCALTSFSFTARKLKNGKYIFGKLQSEGFIGNWKLMECMLGGFGGLFISLGGVFLWSDTSLISHRASTAAELFPKTFMWLPYIMLVFFAIDLSQHLLGKKPSSLKSVKREYDLCNISEKEYERCIEKINDSNYGKNFSKLKDFYEAIERPTYFYVPMILVLLGSVRAANTVAVFMLFIVAAERLFSDRFDYARNSKKVFAAVFSVISIVIFIIGELLFKGAYSAVAVWLFLLIEYEFFQLWDDFRPIKVKRLVKKLGVNKYFYYLGSLLTMHIYYLFVLGFLIKVGIKLF